MGTRMGCAWLMCMYGLCSAGLRASTIWCGGMSKDRFAGAVAHFSHAQALTVSRNVCPSLNMRQTQRLPRLNFKYSPQIVHAYNLEATALRSEAAMLEGLREVDADIDTLADALRGSVPGTEEDIWEALMGEPMPSAAKSGGDGSENAAHSAGEGAAVAGEEHDWSEGEENELLAVVDEEEQLAQILSRGQARSDEADDEDGREVQLTAEELEYAERRARRLAAMTFD